MPKKATKDNGTSYLNVKNRDRDVTYRFYFEAGERIYVVCGSDKWGWSAECINGSKVRPVVGYRRTTYSRLVYLLRRISEIDPEFTGRYYKCI